MNIIGKRSSRKKVYLKSIETRSVALFFYRPLKEVKTDSTTIDKIILREDTIVGWLQNGDKVEDKYEEKRQEIRELYNEI